MEGIINVLKPPAMSSSDVVVDIRRLYETKRVGHLGTLDPEAAGVLPVCVGRAVRLFDYLVDKRKEYLCEIKFGKATDTQDAQGAVIAASDAVVSMEQLQAVLPAFRGTQEQLAPKYSALKYNGKKLYDLALAGKEIPEKRREIVIDRLELTEQTGPNRFLLRVGCSRGTYIRTLCADLGERLGVPAHMAFLLRTASGSFTIDRALSLSELAVRKAEGTLAETPVSCEDALAFLPAVHLREERKRPALNGLETTFLRQEAGPVRLYAGESFLGIGQATGQSVKLTVNLYSGER
ncbi:MAG: tRNA pseudouridine(55) synthase TruB [Clostridia bacterium]|nr:tRNA pseudouridine(55) synthase TruB [Clostridia bacterium]